MPALSACQPCEQASRSARQAVPSLGGAQVADAINKAHQQTKSVKILLENMAGQGTALGSSFEDLRDMISHVRDKQRVGVTLDTCHLFAAGVPRAASAWTCWPHGSLEGVKLPLTKGAAQGILILCAPWCCSCRSSVLTLQELCADALHARL